jgi:hypothetical protein
MRDSGGTKRSSFIEAHESFRKSRQTGGRKQQSAKNQECLIFFMMYTVVSPRCASKLRELAHKGSIDQGENLDEASFEAINY